VDDATLREFVFGAYPRLVGGLALVTGSRALAEDSVQEALARAWERTERGERIDSLPAWVTRVALNLARNRLRSLRAEGRAKERLASDQRPSGHAERTEDRVDVRAALATLPRRQREVVVLRYYLDLDLAAIAAVLDVPEGTLKSLLSRARGRLALALSVQDPQEVGGHVRR
jgi:RNA polymerase sigma factor (sigma-70 family)